MQFEEGRYEDALQSCDKALEIIDPADDSAAALRTKVVNRKLKLLAFLQHDDPERYASAAAECDAALLSDVSATKELATSLKKAVERRAASRGIVSTVNCRIVSMPKYRRELRTSME